MSMRFHSVAQLIIVSTCYVLGTAQVIWDAKLKMHVHFPQGMQGLGLIANSGIFVNFVKLHATLNVSIREGYEP